MTQREYFDKQDCTFSDKTDSLMFGNIYSEAVMHHVLMQVKMRLDRLCCRYDNFTNIC